MQPRLLRPLGKAEASPVRAVGAAPTGPGVAAVALTPESWDRLSRALCSKGSHRNPDLVTARDRGPAREGSRFSGEMSSQRLHYFLLKHA